MASALETNAKILSLTHLTELQKKNRKVGPEKSNGFLDVQSSAAINFRASKWHFGRDIASLTGNGPRFITW